MLFFTSVLLIFLIAQNPKQIVSTIDPASNSEINLPFETENNQEIKQLYNEINLKGKLDYYIFELFMIGYNNLRKNHSFQNDSLVTIIDYQKPSTEERFFVINLKLKNILFSSIVAHGKNTGENLALNFSNTPGSLMSSLGFYRTSNTYEGHNGYSLKLEGFEKDINHNAEKRAIVIHGAWYVSNNFAVKYGRLGRSWGCPALPKSTSKIIIDTIKNGSCLLIFSIRNNYLAESKILDLDAQEVFEYQNYLENRN